MFRFISLRLGTLVRLLRARRSFPLENLALGQQLAVLKRRHSRPRLDLLEKLFGINHGDALTLCPRLAVMDASKETVRAGNVISMRPVPGEFAMSSGHHNRGLDALSTSKPRRLRAFCSKGSTHARM
jgi:hypothetical protein